MNTNNFKKDGFFSEKSDKLDVKNLSISQQFAIKKHNGIL